MKYVLDASVALKWILPETDSPKALALLDDYRKQVHELIAPDVFPTEVGHGLSRAERRGILVPPQGMDGLADVLAFLPRLHASLPLLPRAYELSSQSRSSVYDCLYVALAEQEQCEVITADQKLFNNLKHPQVVLL